MEFKDYYDALGVTKNATEAEIKRAFRKMARQYHPDLNPGDKKAEARFKDINEANEVLSDSEKRRKYDELGSNWRAYEQGPNAGTTGGGSSPFGEAGGARTRHLTPEEFQELFGGSNGSDSSFDFFSTFFGGEPGRPDGARQRRTTRPTRGRDLEQAVDLTLEEAFAGTTRRIATMRDGKERTIEVRIPAGIKDGARVRAAGEGGAATRGGSAGDLYLAVRVLPHSTFERRGPDLYSRIAVPVTTAVLGGEVSVPTLGGSSVRLKVPELSKQGRTFRLRGHGMPAVGKAGERGDLYATVDLTIPDALSDDVRLHYEALKGLDERP